MPTRVLLAVPAAPAGRLLAELVRRRGRSLAGVPYASVAVVTLVVRGLARARLRAPGAAR